MIGKLVFKSLRHEKTRFATAVFGVGAATGLVVWSLGLTVTSMGQSREKVRRMTAPYACWVSTGGVGVKMDRRKPGAMMRPSREQVRAVIPAEVIQAVAALPEVEGTWACKTIRTILDFRPDGRVMQGPPLRGEMVQAEATGCPYANATVTGAWPEAGSEEPVAAVCSAVFAARRLKPPPLGSPLVLITPGGTVTVKITAIIDFEKTVSGFPTVFASAGAMREAAGEDWDSQPNLLLCRMRGDAGGRTLKAVVGSLCPPAKADDPMSAVCCAVERKDIESQFASDKLKNFKRQAPLLLTLSVLTALSMLINALTVGVEHKLRVLALLRAAGMTARQVARIVALEGVVIAGGGWLFGLLGGCAVLTVFVRQTPDAFPEGVSIGWVTPVASFLGVAAMTAVSLFWPCRRALRIRPLDVLCEDRSEPPPISWARTWLGFVLLFPMLILAFPIQLSAMVRSILLLVVGIPLHVIGLVLFLPFFVRAIERLTGSWVSALLGLDPRLLHHRISRHFSRTAGMVITLAVGLGAFSAIHIWGGSMMAPFIPSHEFPDVIVSLLPNGISGDVAQAVGTLEGVEKGRCLAIEAEQFFLTDELAAQVEKVSGKAPLSPNILLFGADPQEAYGGGCPLAPFRFLEGDGVSAADALAKGGACVITKMFSRETGLHAGDTLSIKRRRPPGRGMGRRRSPALDDGETPGPEGSEGQSGFRSGAAERTECFRIVGVADVNWHLITSRAHLRGRNGMPGGTMGPVFVSEADARRISGNADKTFFLWLNLSQEYRKKGALPACQLLETQIRERLSVGDENTVRLHHRDEIEDGTLAHGAKLIGDMARAPFWSLVVLSTGVITLLIASFQASAKEIAVMRSVGMTRSQLGRLLLGEAMMTGLCGIVLSLVSGFCIGWTFTGWTRAWMMFGGLPVSLSIPWWVIVQGVGFALMLCVVMAIGPIVWLVRKQDENGGLTVY